MIGSVCYLTFRLRMSSYMSSPIQITVALNLKLQSKQSTWPVYWLLLMTEL